MTVDLRPFDHLPRALLAKVGHNETRCCANSAAGSLPASSKRASD
jgi:hypothetical protein